MKAKLLAVCLLSLLAAVKVSYGDALYASGALTVNDPTFVNPGGSTSGTSRHYYDVVQFTVALSGAYVFELASRNTTGTPSNALDTYFRIYANTFDPAAPGGSIASQDDFAGTLTVLPGPFASIGLTSQGTGFTGAQPSSRLEAVNLTAGTTYFFVITSFRDTSFVGTGSTAQPTGNYWWAISGPGIIVPEPSTVALLGFGVVAAGVAAWRQRGARCS
jgi:hypothetical protein